MILSLKLPILAEATYIFLCAASWSKHVDEHSFFKDKPVVDGLKCNIDGSYLKKRAYSSILRDHWDYFLEWFFYGQNRVALLGLKQHYEVGSPGTHSFKTRTPADPDIGPVRVEVKTCLEVYPVKPGPPGWDLVSLFLLADIKRRHKC